MASDNFKKELKTRARQLEWLIITMVGTTLGSIQILNYIFTNAGAHITLWQSIFDWIFAMTIITFLVHFSFREIRKIQEELIEKKETANKTEKRLEHIIDNTQDAIFIIDSKGKFIFCNKSMEKITGYSCEEMLNMNVIDIITQDYKLFVTKQLNDYKNLGGRHIYIDMLHYQLKSIKVELSFIKIKMEDGDCGFQCVAHEVTENKEEPNTTQNNQLTLDTFIPVFQELVSNNQDISFNRITEALAEISNSKKAFIVLQDSDSTWKLYTNKNGTEILKDFSEFKEDKSYKDIVDGTRTRNVDSDDGNKQLLFNRLPRNLSSEDIIKKGNGNKLTSPIVIGDKFTGLIGVYHSDNENNKLYVNLITVLSGMLTSALENQAISNKLHSHYNELARILNKSLFTYDPCTAIHQMRLAILITKVAQKLGLDDKRIEILNLAAQLHDIGKLAIPYNILNKAGQLNNIELNLIRSHTKRGFGMLSDVDMPPMVKDLILHHHERLDGSGYPHKISGDDLNFELRILGACDVAEAMGSHRPYRQAFNIEDITHELIQGKNSKYDPNVVDCIVGMINNGEYESCFSENKLRIRV